MNLAYEKGTSELPVVWDLSAVDRNQEGTYEVTGVGTVYRFQQEPVGRKG